MAIPSMIATGSLIINSSSVMYNGGGTNYVIETPTGKLYRFYINNLSDPVFSTSEDYGITWSAITQLKAITCTQFAVWYDRWTDPTGVLGDLIHVVYTDAASDDVFYITVNTASNDALGTERTIFAGASTANGGAISIARMMGGNLIVAGSIDAGAENFAYKSADYFASAPTAISNPYEASPDRLIMLPGWGADNQDAMCFYYDNDALEVSVKYYDDSANSWSEASIATSITHPNHTTTNLGHWAATIDHANGQNLIVFWTATDAANADLRVFKVTQSAQTETAANVVLNSTDDQGFCAITILNGAWYVFYGGKSDGTETYSTSLNLYYKASSDNGANWGSEIKITDTIHSLSTLCCNPIAYATFNLLLCIMSGTVITSLSTFVISRSQYQLGM